MKKIIDAILRFFGLLKEKINIDTLDKKADNIEKKIEKLEKKKEDIDEDKTLDDNIEYFNRK
jgi:predicted ATP-grasp superfamily ATP-dependent carboligase